MAVLVVAAHDGKTVRSNVANAVTAASQMGPEVHVLVAGSNAGEAAKSAAAIQGVAKVLDAEDAAYANWLAEDVAPLVVKLAPNYSHVVMAADSVGKNLAPRVAALLDVAQVSEAIKVEAPTPSCGRSMPATPWRPCRPPTRSRSSPSARPTSRRPPPAAPRRSSRSAAPARAGLPLRRRRALQERAPRAHQRQDRRLGRPRAGERRELQDARGAGRQAWRRFGRFRAAVDAGYVPNDYQVGQTGKVVAPDLYIAIGISGAIQHLAGMKDSKTIVAINKDEEAPIFQVADYGIVGDLFQIVPELTAAVEKK